MSEDTSSGPRGHYACQSLSLLRATLDSTADGILVVNNEGVITAYNEKFVALWRIPPHVLSSGLDNNAIGFVLDQLKDPDGFLNKVNELYSKPEAESFDTLEFKDGRIYERYSRPQFIEYQSVGRVWSFRDVTERRRIEEQLRESEARFRRMLELTSDWYWKQDEQYRFVDVPGLEHRQFHRAAALGKTRWELPDLGPLPQTAWQQHRATLERHESFFDFVFPRFNKYGDLRYLSVTGEAIFDRGGEFKGYHGTGKDVTERVLALKALERSESRFRALTELSSDWYWEQDELHRFTDITKGSLNVPGWSREAYVGKTRWELPNSRTTAAEWDEHKALLEAHQPFHDFVHRRLDQDGRLRYLSVSGRPIFDEEGNFKGYRGVTKEITEQRLSEERVRHLAHYDEVTGLPNRNLFHERLSHAIAKAQRNDENMAVLFIDLDRFKNLNDTLGHDWGDAVLAEMAVRLRACLRESDSIARFGGDEFVVLIEAFMAPSDVVSVVKKLLSAITKPYEACGQQFTLSASVGISTYPEDGRDSQSLLKNADIAMYQAKEQGGSNYEFYSAELNTHSIERLSMESDLRTALERGELLMRYQPIVELTTKRVVGVEALIRWQHPKLGLVLPEQFIPIAEETGLIVPIGHWALKTACAQNRAWQLQGMPPLRMAINISARQFMHEQLVEDVAEVLKQTGLDADYVELELTESTVMRDPEITVKILMRLRAMGIHLAIDDFGTGYSSLAYIKRFPIDSLKIDRSFIQDIPGDDNDVAITTAIIALAQSLNLKVVAEGVENAEQLTFLDSYLCNQIQGYYFSKPLTEQEFGRFLRARRVLEEMS